MGPFFVHGAIHVQCWKWCSSGCLSKWPDKTGHGRSLSGHHKKFLTPLLFVLNLIIVVNINTHANRKGVTRLCREHDFVAACRPIFLAKVYQFIYEVTWLCRGVSKLSPPDVLQTIAGFCPRGSAWDMA